VKIEIVLGDDMVDKAVDTIRRGRTVLLGVPIPEGRGAFLNI
jgi:hypothetical protein